MHIYTVPFPLLNNCRNRLYYKISLYEITCNNGKFQGPLAELDMKSVLKIYNAL